MTRTRSTTAFGAAAMLALTTVFALPSLAPADAGDDALGARLYQRHCASCHGPAGRGDGPDAVFYDPPPRDLTSGVLARYDTDALVRRIRDGAPLSLALDLPALRARAGDVETIAAHLERLPAINWRQADAGHELYIDQCEICHGPFGRAPADLPRGVEPPRDLAAPDWQRATSDATILRVVRRGHEGMPAMLPRIGEADGPALLAFVRLLSPGYEQYSRQCAACHGDDGRGDGGFSEAFQRPTVPFDRHYFATTDPETVRRGIWHMVAERSPAMPHMRGVTTERGARLIVEHLRRAPPAP
jgi:mono/diheme cytochrome c family protein